MASTLGLNLIPGTRSALHYGCYLVHRLRGSDCNWRNWNIEVVGSHVDGLVERRILEGDQGWITPYCRQQALACGCACCISHCERYLC